MHADLSIRGPADASGLHRRLMDGVGAAFADVSLASHADIGAADPATEEMWRHLDMAGSLTDAPGPTPAEVDEHVACVAEHLGAHRNLLLAVVLRPTVLLEDAARRAGGAAAKPVHVWIRYCWASEAAWRAVESGKTTDRQFASGDLSLLRPAAARQRFVMLTEPLRHMRVRPAGWDFDDRYGVDAGLPELVFGVDAAHDVLGRCREARWVWLRCLDKYQSHPLLAGATGSQIEAELDLLAFRDGPGSSPLVVSWRAARGHQPSNADDRAASDDVVERHLLPRFRMGRVVRLAGRQAGRATVSWSVAVAGTATAAVGLAGAGWFWWAAIAACVAYLVLGLGIVACGRTWAAQWLLRLPAAGAFGLVALTTLHPDWWTASRLWGPASAVLLAASYGYLVVEACNHGVDRRPALLRAFVVTAVGAGHALLVSLVGLVLVTPEYSEQGALLAGVWSGGHWPAGTAWAVLLSGAAWCLAVGVFSQILWDDRPITAPLAHMRWTRKD